MNINESQIRIKIWNRIKIGGIDGRINKNKSGENIPKLEII